MASNTTIVKIRYSFTAEVEVDTNDLSKAIDIVQKEARLETSGLHYLNSNIFSAELEEDPDVTIVNVNSKEIYLREKADNEVLLNKQLEGRFNRKGQSLR